MDEHELHRMQELERKVSGMQRQINVLSAQQDAYQKKNDMSVRDLEIVTAVLKKNLTQRQVAEIYQLSPGRINQILKKVG